jgi:hypothetical protein
VWQVLYQKHQTPEDLLLAAVWHGQHSLSATQKRREAGYAKKFLMAQQLIEQYGQVRRREGWKEWVCAKTSGETVEITEKWLTRALNSGKLIPPAGAQPDLCRTS